MSVQPPSRQASLDGERPLTVERPAIHWTLRIALLIAATGGLATLALVRPALPPNPWAQVRPEPRDLIEGIAVFLVWLALIYVLLRLVALALFPPRVNARIVAARPPWASPPSRPAPWRPRQRQQADPLLELFARPPLRQRDDAVVRDASANRLPEAEVFDDIDLPLAREPQDIKGPLLRVLGSVCILCNGQEVALPQNTQAILAYLVVKRRRAGAEEIAQALWPDHDLAQGRQRVWRAMRPSGAPLAEVVTADKGGYELRHGLLELDEVERLGRMGDAASLERALVMFRGEPFADLDYDWLTPERSSIHGLHAELLERSAKLNLETRPARARAAALQLIALDRFNEAGWRLAMSADAKLGRRQAVLDRYENLRAMLTDELGLAPQAETRTVYHQLLSDTAEIEA